MTQRMQGQRDRGVVERLWAEGAEDGLSPSGYEGAEGAVGAEGLRAELTRHKKGLPYQTLRIFCTQT